MDRGACQVIVYGVAKSQTQMSIPILRNYMWTFRYVYMLRNMFWLENKLIKNKNNTDQYKVWESFFIWIFKPIELLPIREMNDRY